MPSARYSCSGSPLILANGSTAIDGLSGSARVGYQRALDKIAATAARHGIAAGMYFIPPGMDPNFFVQKGFKFFTMPWAPWATAGIQNALAGIKR